MVTANLEIKAVPGASRTEIAGFLGTALKVRVAAPPEKGKANEAIRKLLSEQLGLPLDTVILVKGSTSPKKILRIEGISEQELQQKLNTLI